MISLGPKGVLEDIEEDNRENYERSKDVFFRILTNIWLFCVLIADLKSSERGDSEYIEILWMPCVDWLWEKEETFFFFSAGVEIEGFWKNEDESARSKKIESFYFDLLISPWICRSIAIEDKDIE